MSQPAPSTIISHWYNLVENFNYSTQDYYNQIGAALIQRQIPDIKISRVHWKEGGVFSAKREYLRVKRGRHVFDICGAPFGTGYFVSWWLGQLRKANIFVVMGVLFILFTAGLLTLAWLEMLLFSNFMRVAEAIYLRGETSQLWIPVRLMLRFYFPGIVTLLGLPLLLLLLFLFVRANPMGIEDTILEIPYLGYIYERLFIPATYYKIDTALMFQSMVHTAVLQVLDEITTANGLRALSEAERKPIMREFYQK